MMSQTIMRIVPLVVAVAVSGCGRGNGKASNQPLEYWLETPARVRVGEIAPLRLRVKNNTKKLIELSLGGRPAHNFSAANSKGALVWEWLHNQIVQDILEIRMLAPGEELIFKAEWNQRDNDGNAVATGTYFLRGILNIDPPKQLVTEPVKLMIVR